MASDMGFREGHKKMHHCYEEGIGVPQDYKKALHYITLAARSNDPEALVTLGEIYAEGSGVKANGKRAVEVCNSPFSSFLFCGKSN